MKNRNQVEIRDARRKVEGKYVQAYRVCSVGKNSEQLQISEVLNDKKAVNTHIAAMHNLWDSAPDLMTNVSFRVPIKDKTKLQVFAKKYSNV